MHCHSRILIFLPQQPAPQLGERESHRSDQHEARRSHRIGKETLQRQRQRVLRIMERLEIAQVARRSSCRPGEESKGS